MIDALYCRSTAVLLAMHVWLYVVAVLYMVSGAGRPHGVRASASLDVKNCLFHALARTYAHFFISILYVNFQFGSNEYILIVWHSSSLAARSSGRVDVGLRPRHSPEQLRCEGGGVPNNQNVFIRPELEVYIQNTSEKMRVSA